MGKFRSKLKRHGKGKAWSKGHSSTSNPENMKHRSKAKSRFFQPNLSLAPQPTTSGKPVLTLDAVMKHDARQMYSKNAEPTINDIAGSLKSFSLDGDELMSESQGTFKTFQTFASNYSACSNMSFKKLLNGFRSDSQLHKEMLAVLTALTEVIKERGGTESSTEYFLLLMETIEAGREESELVAGVSLLAMGIKSVPPAVLRKKFSDTAETLLGLFEQFIESDNQGIIRSLIGCMSVLLRAQEYATWSYSSTTKYFDALLSFTVHTKHKIRKAAQHAIVSIIHGSCFMIEKPEAMEQEEIQTVSNSKTPKYHPAGSRLAKFCLNQFKPELLVKSQTIILHTLGLLRETLSVCKEEDIKTVSENMLSIMTAANVLIRTNCFQTFHALFSSPYRNLSGDICMKLLSALYEYRPDKGDARQMLAWLTVLKQGHVYLASVDLDLCINVLPKFVEICTADLWMSERVEIVAGTGNALKEILYDCVRPACAEKDKNRVEKLTKIINSLSKALSAPFGEVTKYVILTFSIVFEVAGEFLSEPLKTSLISLGSRYDPKSSLTVHIEHAILAGIKSMGPDKVLKAIPLTNSAGDVSLDKSWLLPLMREGINGASFEFFANYILKLAADCNKKWHEFAEQKNISLSHTYELLCCQLWGLFPGFCRRPKDPQNFKLIARTLGVALTDNPEYRAPILDGFKELLADNENANMLKELGKYGKNFLPILFNIYTTKPTGTYEAEIRGSTLNVIKEYLKHTPEATLAELFKNAREQLESLAAGSFTSEAVFDIIAILLIYQNEENLKSFYKKFIIKVLSNEKSNFVSKDEQRLKKQQRKAYELLNAILISDREECKKFVKTKLMSIQNLLLDSLKATCSASQASRLRCLKQLIEKRDKVSVKDKLIVRSIPEAILSYKEFSTKKENISQELIILIGELYQKADQINDFVDIVMAGFGGDKVLVTNTILGLKTIVQNLSGNLTVATLEFILQQILVFIVQKNRNEVEAAIVFLITFIKVLPIPLVGNHLTTIMQSLSAMVPDTKRYCRIQIGYILKKLTKKFGAQELIKLVPGNDETTHKRLKKIRKELSRENRKKLNNAQKDQDGEESDEEFVSGLEKKSVTIDDILADSDSDLTDDEDEEAEKSNKTASKRKAKSKVTFIQENPEDIVDLADIKSIGNILTNHPKDTNMVCGDEKRKNDPNRGFKTADDGRLIISDKPGKGGDSDDDDAEDDDDDGNLVNKTSKKRGMEDDSSNDEEMPAGPSRKRKALESASMKSGKSGAASRYTAGGKGIHRPVAASVKSGYSAKTKYSSATTARSTGGTEYSSRKAKGDMKKKGKVDPYAYIPLSRNVLNKRKRAKNAGQFKSIVTGARKGAAKGMKNRVHKAYKQK